MPQLFEAEFAQRNRYRCRSARPHRPLRIMEGQPGRIDARRAFIELWRAAHGEEDVGGERHVEHFLHRHAHDDPARLVGEKLRLVDILSALDVPDERVVGVKIDRDGREFDFDRGLEISGQFGQNLVARASGIEKGYEFRLRLGQRSHGIGLGHVRIPPGWGAPSHTPAMSMIEQDGPPSRHPPARGG